MLCQLTDVRVSVIFRTADADEGKKTLIRRVLEEVCGGVKEDAQVEMF